MFTHINLKEVVVAQYYKKSIRSVLVLVFLQQVNNLSWFIPIFFLPSIDKLLVCITVHNYPKFSNLQIKANKGIVHRHGSG